MGEVDTHHSPLVSGLEIATARTDSKRSSNDNNASGGGTLTAIAKRDSDGKPVIVSNLHVMAGRGR